MDDQENTYNDYLAFTNTLLQEALATKKFLGLDLYLAQIANIKQLIYLAATASTAIAALIATYWSTLRPFTPVFWCIAALAVCLIALIGCFMFGIYALRGENRGTLLLETTKFLDRAKEAYKPDSEFGSYEAKMTWINDIDLQIPKYLIRIDSKGKKIRGLNFFILVFIGCATAATVALFSITLYEKYHEQQRATEICPQGPVQLPEAYTITTTSTCDCFP